MSTHHPIHFLISPNNTPKKDTDLIFIQTVSLLSHSSCWIIIYTFIHYQASAVWHNIFELKFSYLFFFNNFFFVYSRLVLSGIFQTDIGQVSVIELIKFSCTLCSLYISLFCIKKNRNVTHEIGHELIICVFCLHQSYFLTEILWCF